MACSASNTKRHVLETTLFWSDISENIKRVLYTTAKIVRFSHIVRQYYQNAEVKQNSPWHACFARMGLIRRMKILKL